MTVHLAHTLYSTFQAWQGGTFDTLAVASWLRGRTNPSTGSGQDRQVTSLWPTLGLSLVICNSFDTVPTGPRDAACFDFLHRAIVVVPAAYRYKFVPDLTGQSCASTDVFSAFATGERATQNITRTRYRLRPELACLYVALLAARSSDDVATGDCGVLVENHNCARSHVGPGDLPVCYQQHASVRISSSRQRQPSMLVMDRSVSVYELGSCFLVAVAVSLPQYVICTTVRNRVPVHRRLRQEHG